MKLGRHAELLIVGGVTVKSNAHIVLVGRRHYIHSRSKRVINVPELFIKIDDTMIL